MTSLNKAVGPLYCPPEGTDSNWTAESFVFQL